ncbi:hypothetical protein SAMN02745135_01057 [Caloranaerobacter azorensis DSM 13643]|uniref:YvlB/LiaX N-terminal domain-containing protein n=1 Tax=Caloranaerobacter azorensis DSM 13643 TaxID=1121264 RepID=A0A1M5TM67_9FIRM|nr:hypothetical protein [Caloranaerobacter azorensis]SHH51872.1 hypothetical protein SAMN02745135_01057 [Caloranaerobacter azorensis DSM 13643]
MSNFKEEKLQILKMIEEGKITHEEGLELLNALEEKDKEFNNTSNAKWLKIRVYDPDDETKVNVNIPIALVDVGLKFATKFSPELKNSNLEDLNLEEIIQMIKNGAQGKIVDVTNERNGEKVEIFVE